MNKDKALNLDRERRLKWFRQARFGMFIHWGIYAQVGRHEWLMDLECWPLKEYEKLADTWHPKPGAQREWARLARQAGCRYMVMTSRHHDGFSLFKTQTSDYNAVDRGPGRDLVAEYVEACRAEGLRVGIYYSIGDWHHPDHTRAARDERARRRYVDYIHTQVRELCSNYGKLDIMWYDGCWLDARTIEAVKLNAMVRELQPDILINNRANLPEDFGTPEGHIRAEEGGRMWEACMTSTRDSWGYAPIDHWKTPFQIVSMLRECAVGGGNLLLNIGPDGKGNIPPPARRIFTAVGKWMDKYGASIYDATDPEPMGWIFMGSFTACGNTLYFHCYCWPGRELILGGLASKVRSVRFMNGPRIKFRQTRAQLILSDLPVKAPDPLATVIELEFSEKPKRYPRLHQMKAKK